MREIKFRAYVTEEMVKSQWLTGFGVMLIEMSDDYAEKTGKKKEVFLYTESGTFEVFEDSVGQYTGLKDKNGVEIYEGDIIRTTTFGFDSETFVTSIIFDKAGFKLANGRNMFYFGQKDFSVMDDTVVIGNVFENPELLEVAK